MDALTLQTVRAYQDHAALVRSLHILPFSPHCLVSSSHDRRVILRDFRSDVSIDCYFALRISLTQERKSTYGAFGASSRGFGITKFSQLYSECWRFYHKSLGHKERGFLFAYYCRTWYVILVWKYVVKKKF